VTRKPQALRTIPSHAFHCTPHLAFAHPSRPLRTLKHRY
jgi:hypothetical protein